jgi:transposase InsO family protein
MRNDRVPDPAPPHPGLAIQDAGATGSRDFVAATPIEYAASARTLEAEADGGGPTALRLALSAVSVGVERRDDCPTGDGYPVASDGVPPVLALDVAHSGGRPKIPGEIRRLIREMSLANRLWGAPRIHGELLKLGIEVAQSTVAKYMARSGRGSSQTWKTFLHNHAAGIGAMDFLVVPTVDFRLLFVLVILRHQRRRLISLSVTANPTAEWIARQITEAFPWDEAPDYMIRDRDASYGQAVTKRLAAMGIRDHPIAPRSPWQNGHAERLIGSIRRECLDHVVVFGEAHLRRILAAYTGYYNELRTHLSLGKNAPSNRPIRRLG